MTIFIPGNVPSSKNSKVWTGKFLVHSKATRVYISATKSHWIENRKKFQNHVKNLPKPLKVGFHFVRGTKHKYDFVNPIQTIQDLMVAYRWVPDDNIEEMLPFPVKHPIINLTGTYSSYSKETPGVYITI